jgi:hypothetical protein
MRAVLRLEVIGDNYLQHQKLINQGKAQWPQNLREMVKVIRYGQRRFRPWVARLRGLDEKYGFAREFVVGMRDYSLANSIGSRGVYEYFALEDGIYEVNECVKLGHSRRYFIRVESTQIIEISREEVEECLLKSMA